MEDYLKYIVSSKLENFDNKEQNGDAEFDTWDYIYLDAKSDMFQGNDLICAPKVPTDYALLLGAGQKECGSGVFKGKKTCAYWLRNNVSKASAYSIMYDGIVGFASVSDVNLGISPSMRLDAKRVADARAKNLGFYIKHGDGNHYIEFGSYPQTVVNDCTILETMYQKCTLSRTGKKYTAIDNSTGKVITNNEYEYDGVKYVRVVCNKTCEPGEYKNGSKMPKRGSIAWVKVEPINWIIKNWDKLPKSINPDGTEEDTSIDVSSVKCLISGIPFSGDKMASNVSLWQNSQIRAFLNGYDTFDMIRQGNGNVKYLALQNYDYSGKGFMKEAFEEQTRNMQAVIAKQKAKGRLYQLSPQKDVAHTRQLTQSERINMQIRNRESILLSGPSGIGKTEIVRTLFPNLIYLKIHNNMFPEKIVGSINLQTGEAIPPDFAREAILSYATEEEIALVKKDIRNIYKVADAVYERTKNEKEPLVIMLDELLNANPEVQQLCYTLVLNKMVEMGRGLKLPANTVIVATGNPEKYSIVSKEMPEPLQKRFDHVYNMRPNVSQWLTEYAIPNKVHPMVIGYIFSKYLENGRDEDMANMGYFYEDPQDYEVKRDEYGQRVQTNDPRTWVKVSDSLYHFESDLRQGKYEGIDIEEELKRTLKLRNEWAEEFFDYYNRPTITPEEIMDNTYSEVEIPNTINEKYACIGSLLTANEEQVAKCRQFIKRYCDPEYLAVYDIYWVGKDENRMEKLEEIEQMEKSKMIALKKIGKTTNENNSVKD